MGYSTNAGIWKWEFKEWLGAHARFYMRDNAYFIFMKGMKF